MKWQRERGNGPGVGSSTEMNKAFFDKYTATSAIVSKGLMNFQNVWCYEGDLFLPTKGSGDFEHRLKGAPHEAKLEVIQKQLKSIYQHISLK